MNKLQIILAILLAVLSTLAVIVALNAIVFGGRLDLALVAAVILLAMAQLLSLLRRAGNKQEAALHANDLMQANDTLFQEVSFLRRRLDRVENDVSVRQVAASDQLGAQVQALEHSVAALTNRQLPGQVEPAYGQGPAYGQEPALRQAPVSGAGMMSREFDLYLEPVVRVTDSRTAYYRASLGARGSDAERTSMTQIIREAERAGTLGELDLAVFELAVPVIRRLRRKRRAISVFCPVSASSFADDGFIGSLIYLLEHNRDVARDLVVEISQPVLSRLNEKGQEGLAHLAQLGATFALSNIQRDVPDLATLSELGFAFLSADVRLLVAIRREDGIEASMLFDQAARSNVQVIAADVVKQSEFAWIDDVVPLAYGAYFSPPRLVRHDITVAAPAAQVA